MSAFAASPDLLICAGLDPSGGAGLIADVRVVSALGCRPVGVVTALTVQNTTGVTGVDPISPDRVREQLEFLLSDIEVFAVKIGMLGASPMAEAIASALALTRAPVVWDPVIHPSLGDVRLTDKQFEAAVAALAPHVRLLTPNVHELALLTGLAIGGLDDAVHVGGFLAERLGVAVLVKGGHLGDASSEPVDELIAGTITEPVTESLDVLCHGGGYEVLHGPRTPGGERVHGTGCALSSAIAAHLARGLELVAACRAAKAWVAARIASPVQPGRGAPVTMIVRPAMATG